jgi:hypothetical protein
MVQENSSAYGSIRVRGTIEEMKEIEAWTQELSLLCSGRDLYDRWSNERIWSFDFNCGEHFFMFLLSWQEKIIGYRIEKVESGT